MSKTIFIRSVLVIVPLAGFLSLTANPSLDPAASRQ